MTTAQPLTCRNCGDLFTAPERPCPHPSPGREYKETGRGGHMFVEAPAALQEPLSAIRLQAIAALSKVRGPHAGSGCKCNGCLQATALVDLHGEYERLRTECRRLRRAVLETTGVFTHEQIERLMEVEP